MERTKRQKLGMRSLWHPGFKIKVWCSAVKYIYVLMFMLKRILNLCSIINGLYSEWTVKFSVTNAIHVTVCKTVRGKGIMKSIKFQFN